MCINIIQNIKAVAPKYIDPWVLEFVPEKTCIYIRTNEQNKVQLPVILRIFDENQNPVDMHTTIMCINILQNIKAVALKL
jgi:hypothetical protein